MIQGSAIVLTNGWLDNIHAKTTHGLLRHSERFDIKGIVDEKFAGHNIAEIVPGADARVPVLPDLKTALEQLSSTPKYCIVGVAVHGGLLPSSLRGQVREAIQSGLSIVCGLHSFLSEDTEFASAATQNNVDLHDIRRPRPASELRFWNGEIYQVKTPRIAILGTDCAIGKRTTAQQLADLCNREGIRTEMIYTGQTGWMQGFKHGFIFDATVNDFIGGEIERVILECEAESSPALMLIEGQSSLRNPSGPCGSEFLKSGDVKAVILQHAPGRPHFDGLENEYGRIPSLHEEIELIRLYGARTIAITLNESGMSDTEIASYQQTLSGELGIPVVRPFKDGMGELLPAIQGYMKS